MSLSTALRLQADGVDELLTVSANAWGELIRGGSVASLRRGDPVSTPDTSREHDYDSRIIYSMVVLGIYPAGRGTAGAIFH